VAVETSDGTWRAEKQWPPTDSHPLTTALRTGSYTDDGENTGTGAGSGQEGVWTFSPPLAHDAHLAGVPRVTLDTASTAANANLVVDVYDLDAANRATLISRSATLLRAGADHVSFALYGNDWLLPAGHRLGVLVSSANSEWWLHFPTSGTVTIAGGQISLPFLTYVRPTHIAGGPSIRLDKYLAAAPFVVPQATIDGATSPVFGLPSALRRHRRTMRRQPRKGARDVQTRTDGPHRTHDRRGVDRG
jgi:predicted acyl esterase